MLVTVEELVDNCKRELLEIVNETKRLVEQRKELLELKNLFCGTIAGNSSFLAEFKVYFKDRQWPFIEFRADVGLNGQHGILQLSIEGKTLIDFDLEEGNPFSQNFLSLLSEAKKLIEPAMRNPVASAAILKAICLAFEKSKKAISEVATDLLSSTEELRSIEDKTNAQYEQPEEPSTHQLRAALKIEVEGRLVFLWEAAVWTGKNLFDSNEAGWSVFIQLPDRNVRPARGNLVNELHTFEQQLEASKSLAIEAVQWEIARIKQVKVAREKILEKFQELNSFAGAHPMQVQSSNIHQLEDPKACNFVLRLIFKKDERELLVTATLFKKDVNLGLSALLDPGLDSETEAIGSDKRRCSFEQLDSVLAFLDLYIKGMCRTDS